MSLKQNYSNKIRGIKSRIEFIESHLIKDDIEFSDYIELLDHLSLAFDNLFFTLRREIIDKFVK